MRPTIEQVTTDAPSEKPEVPTPPKDPLTGGMQRALDYKDAFEAFVIEDWEGGEDRYYASSMGRCLRHSYYKVTNTPMDEGQAGFDDGIGERGNAVEDRITLMLRATHGHDAVLQNVRLTKRLTLTHPVKKTPHEVAIVCRTDPVVIGDNLEILKLYEIKTKGWFSEELKRWPKEGMWKVPLYMAGVEEKATCNVPGAANINNLFQLAIEARILRENGRPVKQPVLMYVSPDKLSVHLEVLLSDTDVSVLSELAIQQTLELASYVLAKKVPPPLYAMAWEEAEKTVEGKKVAFCEYRKRCLAQCAADGDAPRLNPMFGNLNDALKRARNAAAKQRSKA